MISITTAQRNIEERNRYGEQFKDILMQSGFNEVEFIDIEFENPDKLREFPLICIQGGDPFYLLDQIKRTKTDSILKDLNNERRILIGHSAGASVLGSTIAHAKLLHPEWPTTEAG
jgi:dipeptidase E